MAGRIKTWQKKRNLIHEIPQPGIPATFPKQNLINAGDFFGEIFTGIRKM